MYVRSAGDAVPGLRAPNRACEKPVEGSEWSAAKVDYTCPRANDHKGGAIAQVTSRTMMCERAR